MLRRVAAFYRPLRPVLLPVLFPRSRNAVVGVPPPAPPPRKIGIELQGDRGLKIQKSIGGSFCPEKYPPQKRYTPPTTIYTPQILSPPWVNGRIAKSVSSFVTYNQTKHEQIQGTFSTPLQSHSLEESSDCGLLLDIGNTAGGMGHSCRCFPNSISTCDIHIHKSLIRIKPVVWHRAEACPSTKYYSPQILNPPCPIECPANIYTLGIYLRGGGGGLMILQGVRQSNVMLWGMLRKRPPKRGGVWCLRLRLI